MSSTAFYCLLYSPARCLNKVPLRLKSRTAAEQRWLIRQSHDPFVKSAKEQNYRCRSAFKLLEIDDKHKILRPGIRVVDCGAAPGAWSQVAVHRVNAAASERSTPVGFVIGVDLLRIAPLPGAVFLSAADITDSKTQSRIQELLPGGKADVILSDMAPSASGIKELDHEKLITMCFSLLDLIGRVLEPKGVFLCKLWDGAKTNLLQSRLRQSFHVVRTIKPSASRKDSAEIYFLSRDFQNK
ncbi:rRNA methyltransferase 2, mitochondrial isoform X2 [Protopterus annectens]|nr:rRNA methyltransferase 2, mitochondrial isoform X2 [Protopterus annectens]